MAERLFALVDRTQECWIWTGKATSGGYGKIRLRQYQLLVHRVAYIYFVGPIPTGLLILHACDTPLCVNPAHLRVGTHQENADDKMARNRHRNGWGQKTHCQQMHPLGGENLLIEKGGKRRCRECKRARQREWRARQRDDRSPI